MPLAGCQVALDLRKLLLGGPQLLPGSLQLRMGLLPRAVVCRSFVALLGGYRLVLLLIPLQVVDLLVTRCFWRT